MPRFVDYHAKMPEVTPEMAQMMQERIRSRKADEFGAVAVEIYMGKGEAFCVTDAPNAQAVVKSHTSKGFPLDFKEVHQVSSLSAA